MREGAVNSVNSQPLQPGPGPDREACLSEQTGMIDLVSAARALLRADDLHLDNRAEKAALRTALMGFDA